MLVEALDVLQSLLLIALLLSGVIFAFHLTRLLAKSSLDTEDFKPERDPHTGLWRYHRHTRFQEKPVLAVTLPGPAPRGTRLGWIPRLLIAVLQFLKLVVFLAFVRPAPTERSAAPTGETSEPPEDEGNTNENGQAPRDPSVEAGLPGPPPRLAVLRFQGLRDLNASGDQRLSEAIDEVLVNRDHFEEAVVIIDSPGGTTHGYGHAYALLERLSASGLKVTACIDRIGASGGYLMALPADRILAGPFAIVGSVGVVAGIPNVKRLLEEKGVSYRLFVAGDKKRVVHFADDDGPEVREYMDEKLAGIHTQFLQAVEKHRGDRVKLDEVRSGDHWSAEESVEKGLGLVDELQTSAEYLLERNREVALVMIERRVDITERFAGYLAARLSARVASLFTRWLRV